MKNRPITRDYETHPTPRFLPLGAAFAALIIAQLVIAHPLLAQAVLPDPSIDHNGGGSADGGLLGEYFSNPDFKGTPQFTRHDVRIDFDWGTFLPVGGSTAEAYRSFPRKNFSIRWTGRIMARYSEDYVLGAEADGGAKVEVKLPGQTDWQTVIDGATPGMAKSSPLALKSGQAADIRVEYRHADGPAYCHLTWSSPSTPSEVIDPVTQNGINAATWFEYTFADFSKRAGWQAISRTDPPPILDDRGWPMGDAQIVVADGVYELNGTYTIQFKGKAELSCPSFSFFVNGSEYAGKLPSGMGYDPATDLTQATFVVPPNSAERTPFINFLNTSRDGSGKTGTGVTDVKIMRPLEPGSTTPHSLDEVIYRPIKKAYEPYTCLRWVQVACNHSSGKWGDRTPPDYMRFEQVVTSPGDTPIYTRQSYGGETWEDLILLANETGKDLYLATPVNADNDYFTKLAQLLKYGSDGKNPYTSPQANPVYPPLNSNLRVYVEVGNEIWNWAFASSQDAQIAAKNEIQANTPEAAIFNYDGHGNYRTWHALRIVRASDAFRAVFGDAAMGTRVRFLLEYQYNNEQETAWTSLRFLDAYFNNGDGDHVPVPHPVNYYIWGGGGATYYSVANHQGTQDETKITDPHFEQPAIPDGTDQVDPQGGPWTFAGNAGLYRPRSFAVVGQTLGKSEPIGGKAAEGMKFQVGTQPLYVHQLGYWADQSSNGKVYLIRATDGMEVASADLTEKIKAVWGRGLIPGFYYADAVGSQPGPVKLDANGEYYLLATGSPNALPFWGRGTAVTLSPDLTLEGGVKADVGSGLNHHESWRYTLTQYTDHAIGPVSFSYNLSPTSAALPYPTPFPGAQAVFLKGGGSISQTVNFAKAGHYALTFNAALVGDGWYARFHVFCDDEMADPRAQFDYRKAEPTSWVSIGGFARDIRSLQEDYGSAVFNVETPGPHVIRLVNPDLPSETRGFPVISNVDIASADAIMESGFGAGQALGQVASNQYVQQINHQASYARIFGLPVVGYEAGWSLGGDFTQKPIQNWCKFVDPRARSINNTARDIFDQSGSFMPMWGVYTYWPPNDIMHSTDYPMVQSIVDSDGRLPAESTNGTPVPGDLTGNNAVPWGNIPPKWNGLLPTRGLWAGWLIACPQAGVYQFQPDLSGDGTYELEVDGKVVAKGKSSADASADNAPALQIHLSAGTHGVRLRNTGGSLSLAKIGIVAAP